MQSHQFVSFKGGILSANYNPWYFNNLVKTPCRKTPYRCPHRLNLSSQPSCFCAWLNIKMLKDKDLEFANSIRPLNETREKAVSFDSKRFLAKVRDAIRMATWTRRMRRFLLNNGAASPSRPCAGKYCKTSKPPRFTNLGQEPGYMAKHNTVGDGQRRQGPGPGGHGHVSPGTRPSAQRVGRAVV